VELKPAGLTEGSFVSPMVEICSDVTLVQVTGIKSIELLELPNQFQIDEDEWNLLRQMEE